MPDLEKLEREILEAIAALVASASVRARLHPSPTWVLADPTTDNRNNSTPGPLRSR
jgi:hypothetical protein